MNIELSSELDFKIRNCIYSYFVEGLCKSVARHVNEDFKYALDKDSKPVLIGKFNVNDFEYINDFLQEISGELIYKISNSKLVTKVKTYSDIVKADIFNDINWKGIISDFINENKKYIIENSIVNIGTFDDFRELSIDEKLSNNSTVSYIKNRVKEELEYILNDIELDEFEDEFIDIYTKGCSKLGISPDVGNKEIKEYDLDDKIVNIMRDIFIEYINTNSNGKRSVLKLFNHVKNILSFKIFDNNMSIKEFKRLSIIIIRNYSALKKEFNIDKLCWDKLKFIEENIPNILQDASRIEAYEFEKYKTNNPVDTSTLEDIIKFDECKKAIVEIGIVDCIKKVYVNEQTKVEIEKLLPFNPKDEYVITRQMERHFVIHVGETNSGKTYSALNKLKEAGKGAYLAPLRLLALEVQEQLNSEGVKCNLITGEEEDIIPGAYHTSSTVEKANLSKFYNIVVIDECQLIGDEFRGFAWTKAILGILAEEIHLCTAPEGLDMLIKLIINCNDTYEVIEHHRSTELIFEGESFNLLKDVRKGDAIVVFSKKNVLAIASQLSKKGIQVSIIYGGLPYNTRKKQYQRFLSGESEVVVCTDAIGMGINLAISRVILLETFKYDGKEMRMLKVSEAKQIAGRAGRMGIYDVGYVRGVGVGKLLSKQSEKVKCAYVGISDELLSVNRSLIDILKTWQATKLPELYKKSDVSRNIALIEKLRNYENILSKEDMFRLCTLAFDEKNYEVEYLWLKYVNIYSNGGNFTKPSCKGENLNSLESYYKCLDLYYSFGKNFGYKIDVNWLTKQKEVTSDKINNVLIKDIKNYSKKCRECGKHLSWDYPHNICNKCYENSYNSWDCYNYY